MAKTSLGNRLKALRQGRGLDREDIGNQVSCSGVYLKYVEHGEVIPSERMLSHIAQVLEADLPELLRLRTLAENSKAS